MRTACRALGCRCTASPMAGTARLGRASPRSPCPGGRGVCPPGPRKGHGRREDEKSRRGGCYEEVSYAAPIALGREPAQTAPIACMRLAAPMSSPHPDPTATRAFPIVMQPRAAMNRHPNRRRHPKRGKQPRRRPATRLNAVPTSLWIGSFTRYRQYEIAPRYCAAWFATSRPPPAGLSHRGSSEGPDRPSRPPAAAFCRTACGRADGQGREKTRA